MTKDHFSDAVTQIGSDLVERFCSMDERLERKRTKRRIYLKWGTAAACLLLAIGMTFALKSHNELPADIDSIAWRTQDGVYDPSISLFPWNGWHHNYALSEQLTYGDADSYIAIRVTPNMSYPHSTEWNDFHTIESLNKEAQKFENAGACAIVKNHRLFIFVTREQLKTLAIENKDRYKLLFAKQRSYEHKEGDIPTLANDVTGFQYEKFSFDLSYGKYDTPKSDEELIDMLNKMIREGQFDTDRLSFMIHSDEFLTEDMFADMHFESLYIAKYVKSCYESVLYENIDLEALKALSNHPSITSITVYLDIAELEPA